MIRYQSEYADLPHIGICPQHIPNERVPTASTSSSSTQPTAPAPANNSFGDVVMSQVDPVVSDHAGDPPGEISIAHDAIRSLDMSYNDQDSG